jgi:Zn-dependent protease with chaperone function
MAPKPASSLSRRAALALSLWAGFYVLSLGIAGGLLTAAWVLFTWTRDPSLFGILCGLGAIFGAAMILWSSLPRWKKFVPPGPRLDPARHPRLFEMIRIVARDTRQKPPAEVYLDSTVNAWVSSRGGLLGLFSRRVMAIGLPLLKVVSQGQLRCVIAHEFGHYSGGDTFLGPWVHRTGAAIQRTVELLEGNDSIWRFPFLAYGNLFMKVSLAVAQQQELAADALAARIGGRSTMGEALRVMEGAGDAFPSFIRDEFMPVLRAGFRPPLGEGFQRFLGSKDIARFVRRMVHLELAANRKNPFLTHPPLAERLAALDPLPPGPARSEDAPAIELLNDHDALEADLVALATETPSARTMPAVAWSDVGEKAYLPQWRDREKEVRAHVAGLRPEEFPGIDLTGLGRRLERPSDDREARSAAMGAIGVAFAVALRDRGWTLSSEPGERVALIREGQRLEPLHVFVDLAEGKLTPDLWREQCRAAGLDGMTLGAPGSTP